MKSVVNYLEILSFFFRFSLNQNIYLNWYHSSKDNSSGLVKWESHIHYQNYPLNFCEFRSKPSVAWKRGKEKGKTKEKIYQIHKITKKDLVLSKFVQVTLF